MRNRSTKETDASPPLAQSDDDDVFVKIVSGIIAKSDSSTEKLFESKSKPYIHLFQHNEKKTYNDCE